MEEQPIWMNYIKPRTSGYTNRNASVITNRVQAQTIFTGYTRQIVAINKGFRTTLRPTIFGGDDGLTVANLKNGNTWSNPQTIDAIQNPLRIRLPRPVYNFSFIINLSRSNNSEFDFSLYPRIKELYLHDSQLSTITSIPPTLERLDVSNTLLSTFPQPSNTINYNLEYLDLSNTLISYLDDLSMLSDVHTLYLSNMPLTEIPILPPSLNILDLSVTLITEINTTLPSTLLELNISNTQVDTLPNLPEIIQNLYLTDTNISILPQLFNNLKILYIDGTLISSLPSLPIYLQELNISRTIISSLPLLPSSLLILDISSTLISTISYLPPNLLQLNVSETSISSLPSLPIKLQLLNFSSTNMTSVPTLPSSLLYLYFSNNNINTIPTLPNSLLEIDISNTGITIINSLPTSLQILTIANTNITSLPQLPSTLFSLDVTNCRINQQNADIIVTNLYNNNLYNGILYIKNQRDLNDNNIELDITTTIWQQLINPPYNWLIDTII